MGPRELFTRTFEYAVEAVSGSKTCHVRRQPDTFDGVDYSLHEWEEFTRPYLAMPAEFFRAFVPVGGVRVRVDRPADGNRQFTVCSFDSPLPTREKENNTVPFWWFRNSRARPHTVALVAPGWARQDRRLEAWFCSRLVNGGVDAVLLTPPYHQERTPPGCYSGEMFISANVLWTVENFRQFVAEIRLIVQQMRTSYDRIALVGFSSGGFQTGLATLGEEVDSLVGIMTGAQLGGITFHSLLARFVRRDLQRRGVDEAQLARWWAILDLANVGHATRARRIKQYVTLYDAIVPRRYQEALWHAYERPERRDIPSSHYGIYFHLREIARDIAAWLVSDEQRAP